MWGTAGVAEMLLQSHNGVMRLLPALPSAWNNGYVRGLRARGGFEVSMSWTGGTLISAVVYSEKGGSTQVEYGTRRQNITLKPGEMLMLKF